MWELWMLLSTVDQRNGVPCSVAHLSMGTDHWIFLEAKTAGRGGAHVPTVDRVQEVRCWFAFAREFTGAHHA
jgi:hypothetical protein